MRHLICCLGLALKVTHISAQDDMMHDPILHHQAQCQNWRHVFRTLGKILDPRRAICFLQTVAQRGLRASYRSINLWESVCRAGLNSYYLCYCSWSQSFCWFGIVGVTVSIYKCTHATNNDFVICYECATDVMHCSHDSCSRGRAAICINMFVCILSRHTYNYNAVNLVSSWLRCCNYI